MMSANEKNRDGPSAVDRSGAVDRHGLGPVSPAEGYGPASDDPVSYQRYFTKIANPGPTGILAFAMTVFLFSLYSVHTRGVHTPNGLIGLALFVGGLVQFMAGMWEFPRGNVFGAAVFSLYGGFWMSYALAFIPGIGIVSGFSDSNEFDNAFGLYLIVWFMVTVMFLLGMVRRNIAFTALLSFWALTYLMLAIAGFKTSHRTALSDAGGAFGFVTAVIAFYIGVSQLHAAEMSSFVRMPLGHLGTRV